MLHYAALLTISIKESNMFYKLRDFISSKLYSLAHFINPLPTLDEIIGEPLSDTDDGSEKWEW